MPPTSDIKIIQCYREEDIGKESTLAWTDHIDATKASFTKEKKFYKNDFQLGDLENRVEKKAPARESVENDSLKKEGRKVVGAPVCCGSDD